MNKVKVLLMVVAAVVLVGNWSWAEDPRNGPAAEYLFNGNADDTSGTIYNGAEGAVLCITTIPGGIVVNETWTTAGSPYCVTGDISVSLLTIEPGVKVLMTGNAGIRVLSTITAIGTAEQPILFSGKYPNTYWKGIQFRDAPSGSSFVNTIIEHTRNGAIRLINSVSPVFDSCVIRQNRGGGIRATGVIGDLTFANCTFSENFSKLNGGALFVRMRTGKLIITDSVFSHNTVNPSQAYGDFVGGALYLEKGDSLISKSEFYNNRTNAHCTGTFGCDALARGGAIYIGTSGNVTLENNIVSQNQADALNSSGWPFGGSSGSTGGGIYIAQGTISLTNNILSCNTTTHAGLGGWSGGGGLYVNGGVVTFVNNTVARNTDATGVYLAGGTLDIMNSIVFFNNNNAAQIEGKPTVTYSDIQGSKLYPGIGKIKLNPAFMGTGCELDDFKIVLGSPAIDTGNPDSKYNDLCFPPSLGADRNDMGAYGGPSACNWP